MSKNEHHRLVTPARYRVFLFGKMRLECVEEERSAYQPFTPAGWDRQSPWRVLAYLLTRPSRQTYRDPLLDALWPDSPLEQSRRACSIALSQVRLGLSVGGESLLTPRKVEEHSLIHLADQEEIWCDWDAFTHLLTQAHQAEQRGEDALPLWEKASTLSRHEFLVGERYQDWCRGLRERAAGDQRLCLSQVAACYHARGRMAEEEGLLRQVLSTFPQDEDLLSRLVTLLVTQGRFQEALRWSQRTVEALEDEGLEVTAHTKAVLKHLHTKQRVVPFPSEVTQDILRTRVSASASPPESILFDRATQFAVTVIGLVSQWQGRATECAALQVALSKEFHMFEHDAPIHPMGEEYPLSRRQALIAIAALPYGALAAARSTGTEIVPEVFLPQSTAAITSCWSIMRHREFSIVEQALAHCLPSLTALAQKPSPHQQVAANLAAQGNVLMGLVTYHQQPQNIRQRFLYRKQAVELTIHDADPTLRIVSLIHLGEAEGDLEHIPEMLAVYEEAVRLSNHECVSLSIRRKAYISLAWAYARAGQVQQALQYHGEIKTALSLPSASTEDSLYLQDTGPFFEGLRSTLMFEQLGRQAGGTTFYQRSWKEIEEAEHLLPTLLVPERLRLEGINQKALVAVRLGHLDQFAMLSLQGIQGAKALQSEKRRQEIIANWKEARKVWPREPRVMELADALIE